MRSVSFWGKFTSGSRISASRSDLLKVPITKRGTWRGFVTTSLRIQPYEGLFIPGAAASCVFTTGVPPFGLLALQLCLCGSHVGT